MQSVPHNIRLGKRETATALLLKILQAQAEMTADLFDTFHCGYHESYRRARGKMLGTRSRVKFDGDWADLYLERQKFYKLISKLKKDGLVEKRVEAGSSRWSLTKRGQKRAASFVPLLRPSNVQTMISYDIPRSHNADRDWLRRTLQFLDFTLLHQSTWLGKGVLTEAFLSELHERGILNAVHIMEIGKTGTMDPNG